MAEGSYEYECNRAELLGIEPPNKVDFEAALKARQEELENEICNESATLDEHITTTSGKFDELNSILSVTQQRLNKFKIACGSLTNLLKIRGNQKTDVAENDQETSSEATVGDTSDNRQQNSDAALGSNLETMETQSNVGAKTTRQTSDIQQKMSCQFDKLDSMLDKAENAQYAMSHQTKQMKGYLK